MKNTLKRTLALIAGTIGFAVAAAGTSKAEEFSFTAQNHGLTLKIDQAYDDDGVPKPKVSINGAVLRQFMFMQRLAVEFDHTSEDGNRVVAMHHWAGGNGCAGSLTLFSLSSDGFLQSEPVAECVENYSIAASQSEPGAIEIVTYSDETKTEATGSWLFLEDQMVKQK